MNLVVLPRLGRLVAFSHTVFALPFALSMYVVAVRYPPASLDSLLPIIIALVAARTAAMSFNRVVDRKIDAQNERTRLRELPSGLVSTRAAVVLLVLSGAVFMAAASAIGRHCLVLAPFVLLILLGYSLCKRFTSLSHFVLGFCLSMAPGGVWYAVTGTLSLVPLPLMAGVLFWVAGFDILYSCQDREFDVEHRLCSVPAALGIPLALLAGRACHVFAVICLAFFGLGAQLGLCYYAGLGFFAALIASQHRCISPEELGEINAAFFTRNGLASILFFLAVSFDFLLR